MDSVLLSVKGMLGLSEDYEPFDVDVTTHINATFVILNQLGVGPTNTFSINGRETKWSDFSTDPDLVELVKSYMYLKVRFLFDPPLSSTVSAAIEKMIAEFEWRLMVNGKQ